MRVGPETVLTDDPDVVRHMMAVRGRYTRSQWYQALRLDPDRDSVINVIDNDLHTAMRRKMAPGVCSSPVNCLKKTIRVVVN